MLDQSQVQSQKQSLTAQQIQQFLLLEIPGVELADRIQEELASNPALDVATEPVETELSDDFSEGLVSTDETISANDEKDLCETDFAQDLSLDDYASEDEIPEYKLRLMQEQEELREDIPFTGDSGSLLDFLREQFITLPLSDEERAIAEYIVGNLSDDGYFRLSERDIEDDLLFNENLSVAPDVIERVLRKVQSLEPAGVAAKDLQECLNIQLQRLQEESHHAPEQLRRINLAQQILNHYFDDLANRRYRVIMQALKISEEEFASVQHLIRSLNPKPANGFGSTLEAVASRITPDFTVHRRDDQLLVWLNDPPGIPSLRITPEYVVLSQRPKGEQAAKETATDKEVRDFARKRVRDASWFIDAISRRRQTLLSVMQIIVSLQEPFFLHGDVALLRPMVLKDVGDRTGYDISTISRITSRKYVQSDYGIYPLKYFFSEATASEDGDVVSTRKTKALLRDLIEAEDKRKPLSDAQLEVALSKEGLTVARRTVAKYREQLGIPIARLRKEL